jgi:hypothetical protein
MLPLLAAPPLAGATLPFLGRLSSAQGLLAGLMAGLGGLWAAWLFGRGKAPLPGSLGRWSAAGLLAWLAAGCLAAALSDAPLASLSAALIAGAPVVGAFAWTGAKVRSQKSEVRSEEGNERGQFSKFHLSSFFSFFFFPLASFAPLRDILLFSPLLAAPLDRGGRSRP